MAHTIYGQSTIIISKGSDVQNPYVATTLDEFKSYLTSENVGAFVKYAPQSGTPSPVNPIAVGDVLESTAAGDEGHPILYLNTNITPDFSQFPDEQLQNEGGYSLLDVLEGSNPSPFLTAHKASQGSDTVYMLAVSQSPVYAFSETMSPSIVQLEHWGWIYSSPFTVERWGGEAKVSSVNQQDIWGAYISKDGHWTSSSESSEYRPGIYQVISENNAVLYQVLPALTNEGTAEDLAKGKQLINSNGEVVEGTAGGETTGTYTVKVIDYDGTVLLEKKGNAGDVIELPTAPTHDRLVFQEWSASVAVSDNKVTITDNDIMVGAVYTTTSGKNEFDITLTKVTGLSVTLNMDGTKDWGDGTSDTATTHTYTAYGDYTILCEGTTISRGGMFWQSSSSLNYYLRRVRLAVIENIEERAFYDCYSLTNATLSNVVTSIGYQAFYSCAKLTSITIPNSVTSIGAEVFEYCLELTSITIPDGVTRVISRSTFLSSGLTSVTIPDSVTSIGESAFNDCTGLTSVTVPGGVTSIGASAFRGCNGLTNINIPDSVTSIYNSAFYSCAKLTSITIPNNVTSITKEAFRGCSGLTNINIPNSVTSIGASAFFSCRRLISVTMGGGVTSIGNDAFYGCSIMEYNFLQSTSVPTLGNSLGINSIGKIIVPDSLYDKWIAASNWSTYANYIYKASEVTE